MLKEALCTESNFVVFGPLFRPFIDLHEGWVSKRKRERLGILMQWIFALHVSCLAADPAISNEVHVRRCGQLVFGDPEDHERIRPTVHHACAISE